MEHPSPGSLTIRFISAAQALPLRAAVLRPGQGPEAARIAGEDDAGCFHLGVFQEMNSGEPGIENTASPLAVASFLPLANPEFRQSPQYQLRGMAAHPEFRGLGAGSMLIRFGIQHLKEKNVRLLWCKAREKAIPFYLKAGFREVGPLFPIPRIGLHKIMCILL